MKSWNSFVVVMALCAAISNQMFPVAFAWEVPTHVAISGEASRASSVDLMARQSLGLIDGLGTTLKDGSDTRNVREWIEEGSTREDDTFFSLRFLNHFHHPLRTPWNQAGLNDGLTGQSSGIWAQTQNQTISTGSWSWQETRDRFYRGLTNSTKAERESFLAQTFRGLGHQIHLIQDGSSVPHARNEAHPPLSLTGYNIEQWGLRFQRTRASDFAAILGQTPIMPDPQSFSLIPESGAPIPISKFLDTNQYTGSNPDATISLVSSTNASGQPALLSPFGLTEYTNANFVHRNSIFTNTLPESQKWWSPYPRRSSTNIDTEIVPELLTAEDGITDQVVYLKKERDGEQIDHFLKTTYAGVRSSELLGNSEPLAKVAQLDDRVYEDYARLLWPRAVGYSASLLDYFFRGRLDVDISNDPTDATLIRLEGTNGSTEKLDGGTIELYGEDSQGVRTAATPVGSNVVVADPGQPISVTFRPPLNSDKFMAVYKGKLGDEAPEGDFIGAVIGKFINPQRVEQIFTDFTRWYIRSPQGVFPLPLLKSDVDDLQWGDSDNMMVGRSSIGPGRPNIFYTYRINRMLGATHIPLTVTNEVDIQMVNQYSFPFGADSGTTVQFSHVMPYKQYLLWRQARHTQSWVSDGDEPDSGHYVAGPSEVTYGISLLVNETKSTNLTYRVVLDTSSHVLGPGTSQYLWDVWSIHLTTDGRPLALVQVQFTTNNLGSATLPARTLGAPGDSGETPPSVFELSPVQVPFGLPELGPMWLLVDVTTGQMLANTAPPTMTMIHTNGRNAYDPTPLTTMTYRSLFRTQSIGGPQDGLSPWFAEEVPILPTQNQSFCNTERLTKMMDVVASASISPLHVNTHLTQNRSEIAQLEFADIPPSDATILDFPIDCGDDQRPPRGFRITVAPGPLFAPNNVGEFGAGVLRTTPIAGTEKLVFLMSQAQNISAFSQRTKAIAWSPELSRIEGVQEFTDMGLHALTTASRDAALFVTLGNDNQSRLVDFSEGSTTSFPNQLLFDYALLDPAFFYNTSDFKFHVKDSSLASTGQPLSLAPAPNGNPRGRYHLLKARESVN